MPIKTQRDAHRMLMQLPVQFTTVVQQPNQGTIRIRAGYRIRGLFWFFLDKQKEQKENHAL